jgi:hypothetical protein
MISASVSAERVSGVNSPIVSKESLMFVHAPKNAQLIE